MSQNNNGSNHWRGLLAIFIGLIALWFIYNQLTVGYGGPGYGHMGRNYYTGPNIDGFLYNLLALAIQVLWFLLIVGLLVGIFQLVKKYSGSLDLRPLINNFSNQGYTCPNCNEKLSADFKFCPNCKVSLKNTCSKCGNDLLAGWNCCPMCGKQQADKLATGESKNKAPGKNKKD
ncbi:MAG: zinc ribbon domain-containing protein [Thermincolia bacterium]